MTANHLELCLRGLSVSWHEFILYRRPKASDISLGEETLKHSGITWRLYSPLRMHPFIQHELGIVRWCPHAFPYIMMILSCSRWLCNPDPPPTVHWSVHEHKFDNGQESYIRGCSGEDLTVSQVPDAAANVITIILSPSQVIRYLLLSFSLFGMSSNAWLKELQTCSHPFQFSLSAWSVLKEEMPEVLILE